MYKIEIIPAAKIDRYKWDNCIQRSPNSLIYARTFYLDQMADNWHGIIVDDYEGVMPVPWRKKFGIRYSYNVPFIQQLGYFSPTAVNPEKLLHAFQNFIPYGHYNFNYNNTYVEGKGVKKVTNFILPLPDNEAIRKSYNQGFKQSLKHAEENDLTYSACDPVVALELYQQLYKDHLKALSDIDYSNLTKLFQMLSSQNQCAARKISNHTGDILSVAVFVADEKRLYNLINATVLEGRKKEANYLLYDRIFIEFARKGLVFDLEGSELPGVKSFYKKMGAVNQSYYRLHINSLPFPLQFLTPSMRKMSGY